MFEIIGQPPRLANGSLIPIAPATRAQGLVFVSGQLGLDSDGALVSAEFEPQLRCVIERLGGILGQAGCGLQDIVKAGIWLTRKEDFAAFNRIWAETFGERPPARSTVVSELLIPGALVEVDVIAVAGQSSQS